MATLEIDRIEYSTDAAARAAYVTTDSANLSAFSEATIKTQGNYSLKGVATTSASGKLLTHVLPIASDLTNVNNLKFDIRSNRTGENIKLGLCYIGTLPTGGVKSIDGLYTVHQFLSNETFTTPYPLSAEVLVVAGGGGGGNNYWTGAGGGAGGLIHLDSFAISAGSFTTIVGSGGRINSNGQNSTFSSLVASGGGGGGSFSPTIAAKSGGSGGGGSYEDGGSGLSGQGNRGGKGGPNAGGNCAGGGGGAALSGGTGAPNVVAKGGDGLAFSITGTSKYYAGGGGGSFNAPEMASPPASSSGGLGGGGYGSYGGGGPGQANTGGGGGGSERNIATATGSGGSGIVVIRYPTPAVTTVSTITPNIVVADQFQTVNWNLKNIVDADKDLVECMTVQITNADAANTFYLDNFEIAQAIDVVGVIE